MPVFASASFSTPRLVAQRLRPDHFEELRLLDTDPEVRKTLGGDLLSEEESREALARNLDRWERYGYSIWMFYTAAAQEFVGRGTLQHFDLDGTDAIEVGYVVRPAFWNQGYAAEMTGAMLNIAFEELGKAEIYACTLPTNLKSQRVMQKSGLTYQRDFLYKNEWPSVLYRITAEEWRNSHPQ